MKESKNNYKVAEGVRWNCAEICKAIMGYWEIRYCEFEKLIKNS